MRHGPKSDEIAPRVDNAARLSVLPRDFDGAIDGEAFGDAAEINARADTAPILIRGSDSKDTGLSETISPAVRFSRSRAGSKPYLCRTGATPTSNAPAEWWRSSFAAAKT